jgi:integrase/recombinase XerD
VTYNREQKYYSISKKIKNNDWLFLSESDVKSVSVKSPRGKFRDIADEYERIVKEAKDIINGLKKFSWNQFEESYFDKVQKWDNVFNAMWGHIQELKQEGRIGYASSFESTLKAVIEFNSGTLLDYNCRDRISDRKDKYLTGKKLAFQDITEGWLKRFEADLKKKGKSRSTRGIYTRNIRRIFNLAIKKHGIVANYPFNEYQPKGGGSRKIALSAYQISQIANYKTDDPQEQFYRDIFMFSYLACGMNLSDIARLKKSSIEGDEIIFIREKTKNEDDEENKIHVSITRQMQTIINKHGNKAVGHDAFLFPVLRPDWDEVKQYAAIKELTKRVNRSLKQIAVKVGIKERMSSYVARHSWATITKNSGRTIEFVSEMLGHSSVLVTKRYLKNFEKSARKEASEEMEKIIYNTNAV